MKKLLYISLLFGIVLNSYSQTVINLSPDSTLYDLHLLPPGATLDSTTLDRYYVTTTFKLGSTGVTIAEIDTSDVATLTDTIRFYITGSAQPTPTTVLNASIDTSLKVGTTGVTWDSIVLVSDQIYWYSSGVGKNISEVIYTTPNAPTTLTISSPDSDTLTYAVSNFSSPANGTVSDSCMVRWDTVAIPTTVTAGNLVYRGDTNVAETDFFIDMDDSLKVYVSAFAKNDGTLGIGTWSEAKTDSVWIDSTGSGTPLNDNLWAYYNCDEAAGNILDQVGSNDGVPTGTVGYSNANAVINTSIDFNSSDTVTFGTNFAPTDSFAMSFWMETDLWNRAIMGNLDVDGNNAGWKIAVEANPGTVSFYGYTGTGSGDGQVDGVTGIYSTASVNHVMLTYDMDSLRLYINGVRDATAEWAGACGYDVSTFMLGAIPGEGDMDGQIDEIAFWDHYVPSDAQVTWLYNSGSGQPYPYTQSIPWYLLLLIPIRRKMKFIIPLLFLGTVSAQTYTVSNLYIQDSMKLGTSTNSVWIDTIKAGSIIISVDGFDYTMDGNIQTPYDTSNWYFSEAGLAGNSGHHPDTSKPFTEAIIEAMTFYPGDTVFCKKGDLLRGLSGEGAIDIQWDGTAGNHIVFTSYGSGDKPRIWGSAHDSTWSDQGGNVWRCGTYPNSPYTGDDTEIFFRETGGTVTWGLTVASVAALSAEYEWRWQNDSIYVYSTTDPGTAYTSVEIPQVRDCIFLNDHEYLTFDGLELQFGHIAGIDEDSPTDNFTGLEIRNCNMSYFNMKGNAGYAIHALYNNMIVENNNIHDTGRRGISLYNYGTSDISIILVQNNTVYNGHHTTGIDCNAGSTGGSSGDIDSVIIRNNHIYDQENYVQEAANWSEWCFLRSSGVGSGILSNLYFYNNYLEFSQLGGVNIGGMDSVFIFHNTFYGCNTNITSNGKMINVATGNTNVEIKNNIFYGENSTDAIGEPIEIAVAQDEGEIDMDYNLWWMLNDAYRMITINWPEHFYRTSVSFASYKSTYSPKGANSPDPADPTFTDAANGNFHLQTGSPAKAAGVAIPFITTDYDGVARPDPPSIGAFETTED